MSGRNLVKKTNIVIFVLVKFFSIFPKFILRIFFVWSRDIPGVFGMGIRYVLLKNLILYCGSNVSIHQGVFLKGLKLISIGNNLSIHPMCYIDGTGGLTISDDVSIAHSSTILTTNHGWDDRSLSIKYNKITYGSVNISSDVWIGCGCRILAGVNIGSRTIVAAGAVVNKDVESNVIIGGVPAKILKEM